MNEVGGVEKFLVWVVYSKNPTFKMRKAGHCAFHDLIPITMVSLCSVRGHPRLGSAKPMDKGAALTSVLSSLV